MLLVEQPHNKETYETLQNRSKLHDEERTFFGKRVLWDTGVFALDGAARAHAGQSNLEKFDRTEVR